MVRAIFTYLSLVAPLIGCAVEPTHQDALPDGAPQVVVISADAAKGDQLYTSDHPAIIFSKAGDVALTQALHAEDILSVYYDPARLTGCGRDGERLSFITGFYQVDHLPPVSFEYTPAYSTAHRIQETKIKVPAGERLMFWFHSVDSDGCETWDSNYGHNYLVPISQERGAEETAQLTFDATGAISQEGVLRQGGQLTVLFEPSLLSECESYQRGLPQWGITGHLQTDQSEERLFQVTLSDSGELKALEVSLELPAGERLSLWFTASNRYGCYQESDRSTFELQ